MEKYEIGICGKAFDEPGKKRAYTHKHQPDNSQAHTLGRALKLAHENAMTAGDYIDSGLILLKELEKSGFGVFEL